MGKDWIPGGISAAAPGALGTTMYGKRPATGGSMGGGLSAAPRFDPMTPEGGAILDPNRPRGGGFDGEAPVRPTPRPMGPGYDGSGINPNEQFGPRPRRPGGPGYRRGPRSNQPGHGNGNGGMSGEVNNLLLQPRENFDVTTKGTQNMAFARPAQRLPLFNKGGVQGNVPMEGGPVYTPGGANEAFPRGGGGGWV